MEESKPAPISWDALERRPQFKGLRELATNNTLPKLAAAKRRVNGQSPVNALYGGGCFTAMVVVFLLIGFGSVFGFLGFIIVLVISGFIARPAIKRIAKQLIMRTVADLNYRQSVFQPLAQHIGLDYVAAPGGGQGIVKQQTQEGFFQDTFAELYKTMEAHSGQDTAVEVARASGLVELVQVIHISTADEATKKARETGLTRIEDGFSGSHAGISFDAFEVVRSSRTSHGGGTSPAEHALVIVLRLPRPLQATTQLRSRKIGWHQPGEADRLASVRLESSEFEKQFRVRSDDQVEARFVFTPDIMVRMIDLAHGEDIRATAQGDHLTIAFEGPNRFDLTHSDTGLTGDPAVRMAIQQIGEMLDLVEAVGAVFGLE